jgi:hypothetical protein
MGAAAKEQPRRLDHVVGNLLLAAVHHRVAVLDAHLLLLFLLRFLLLLGALLLLVAARIEELADQAEVALGQVLNGVRLLALGRQHRLPRGEEVLVELSLLDVVRVQLTSVEGGDFLLLRSEGDLLALVEHRNAVRLVRLCKHHAVVLQRGPLVSLR